MKKITSCVFIIICLSLLFSSTVSAKSQEWSMERLLEINTLTEEMQLSFPTIEKRSFKNTRLQKRYNDFLVLDATLRREILRKFQQWGLSRVTMADINHNYRNFIYYTNKTFLYHEIEEQIWRSAQTVDALQNGYDTMRTYFQRVKTSVSNN